MSLGSRLWRKGHVFLANTKVLSHTKCPKYCACLQGHLPLCTKALCDLAEVPLQGQLSQQLLAPTFTEQALSAFCCPTGPGRVLTHLG